MMMRGSQSSCRRLVLTYHKETIEFANFAKGQFELVQCASLDGFSVLICLLSLKWQCVTWIFLWR